MAITITPLHAHFAAEIGGLDLRQPLTAEQRAALVAAIGQHAVLVFRDQALDNPAQVAFARNFGEIENPSQKLRHRDTVTRIKEAEVSDISNLDAENKVLARDSRRRMDSLGNLLWHSDASFRRIPGALSMLFAHVVPPKGGETEFADERAGYDALDDDTKALIEPLVAEHSIWHSRAQLGFTDFTEEERAAMPPVLQRVVRTHPGSGRKTLYVGSHASHVMGMPLPEGRLLLRDLVDQTTQRQFVYTHRWRVGDLVLWDNRCTMHRGRPFDPAEPRDLRRVTTRDLAPTVEQAA